MRKVSRDARKSGCANPYNEKKHDSHKVLKTLVKINHEYQLRVKQHFPFIRDSTYLCYNCKISVDAYFKRLSLQNQEVKSICIC
jgi:hypothetical protein